MEMNAPQRVLTGLHRQYNDCLAVQMKEWLELPLETRKQKGKNHPGFCTDEKAKFYNHMRENHPVQYENLDRLDEQLYI